MPPDPNHPMARKVLYVERKGKECQITLDTETDTALGFKNDDMYFLHKTGSGENHFYVANTVELDGKSYVEIQARPKEAILQIVAALPRGQQTREFRTRFGRREL